MFTPKTREELAEIALGALITRSGLTDTNEGSVLHTLAHTLASLAASTERQIEAARAAFDFRAASGAELDARLSELPLSTISRLSATPARGAVEVTIEAQPAELIIEAGAAFGASRHPALLYLTTEAHTIAAGATRATLNLEAAEAGTSGNLNAGAIDQIIDAPAELISVNNPAPISGGTDEESDSALKRRAQLYLQSLARSQPAALEYLAYSHPSTAGRVILASLYEPPELRGESVLFVDDGTGQLESATRAGATYTGTAPAGGVSVIYHEAPAVDAPRVRITTPNGTRLLTEEEARAIPERGVIYITEGTFNEGDSYTLEPYQVFTGIISELQREIEGDTSAPTAAQGWRAAGTRVRVAPAQPYFLDIDLSLTAAAGYDLDTLHAAISSRLLELTYGLRIGAPLYAAQVTHEAMSVEGVLNARALEANTGGTPAERALGDIYPPPARVIRLRRLNLTPTTEET